MPSRLARALLLLGPDLLGIDGQAPAEVSQSVSTWVRDHAEPLYLVDVQSEEAFAQAASVMALGLRTIHAVPLTHAGRVLGVWYLDARRMGGGGPRVLAALAGLGQLAGAYLARRG